MAVAVLVTPRSAERRSEEHTSELQSRQYLVCRLLLEKKKVLEIELTVELGLIWARIRIVLVSPEVRGPTTLLPVQELSALRSHAEAPSMFNFAPSSSVIYTLSLHDALPIYGP